jgi:Glycosyl transferase family 2
MTTRFNSDLLAYRAGDQTISVDAYVREGRREGEKVFIAPAKLELHLGPGKRQGPLPLVSCLMVTKNRPVLAKIAVGCYRAQTWPNRELVILDESSDGVLATWIAGLNDRSIRHLPIAATAETLGALRNRSVAAARGAFVCQWDDDDLQHPARIELAMAAMAATRAPASRLFRQMIWYLGEKRVAISPRRFHENTVLVAKRILPPYPPLRMGEDNAAIDRLAAGNRVVLLDIPELYIYGVHGRNTWPADHMDTFWETATERFEGADAAAILAKLATAYPIADYEAARKTQPASV